MSAFARNDHCSTSTGYVQYKSIPHRNLLLCLLPAEYNSPALICIGWKRAIRRGECGSRCAEALRENRASHVAMKSVDCADREKNASRFFVSAVCTAINRSTLQGCVSAAFVCRGMVLEVGGGNQYFAHFILINCTLIDIYKFLMVWCIFSMSVLLRRPISLMVMFVIYSNEVQI